MQAYCLQLFQDEVVRLAQEPGQRRLRIVEAGPHIGDCMLWAAAELKSRLRATCVEPVAQVVALFRRSIEANGFSELVAPASDAEVSTDERASEGSGIRKAKRYEMDVDGVITRYDTEVKELAKNYSENAEYLKKEQRQLGDLREHFEKVEEEYAAIRAEELVAAARKMKMDNEKKLKNEMASMLQAYWRGILKREEYKEEKKRAKKKKGGKKNRHQSKTLGVFLGPFRSGRGRQAFAMLLTQDARFAMQRQSAGPAMRGQQAVFAQQAQQTQQAPQQPQQQAQHAHQHAPHAAQATQVAQQVQAKQQAHALQHVHATQQVHGAQQAPAVQQAHIAQQARVLPAATRHQSPSAMHRPQAMPTMPVPPQNMTRRSPPRTTETAA
eukprot:g23173.t1